LQNQTKLLEDINEGIIVCPMPDPWNNFYNFMKNKISDDIKIPPPLILAAWGESDFSKNKRFLDHLNMCRENGIFDEVMIFLLTFKKDDWLKIDMSVVE